MKRNFKINQINTYKNLILSTKKFKMTNKTLSIESYLEIKDI